MKTKILLLTLLCVNILSAQLEKAEIYGIGTKITYYMNECGNSIPEAQNKLTFCDSDNNLGVVEASFGLNDHAIKKIIPNHFNDDEVFLTQNGFSIRKTNGEWENIPRGAIPRGGNGNAAALEHAVVNNQGQLIFTNGNRNGFQFYDITTKTFDFISYATTGTDFFYFTEDLAHDPTNNVTYILGKRPQISWNIFKFENGVLSHVNSINSISGVNFNSRLHYKDNKLYLGTTSGLYKLDTSNAGIDNSYLTDNSNYITTVRDIADDNFGNIWVANSNGNNSSAIYKIDLSDDSVAAYQLNDSNGFDMFFLLNLVVNDAGKVYAVAGSDLCGIAELDISSGSPVWTTTTTQDFNDLGFPMMGCNRFVSKHNNKIYLSKFSHSFSSEQGKLEAIVIDDQGNLSGITDNEPTNLSRRMLGGKDFAYPDEDGTWFHDSGIVMKMNGDDSFQRFFSSDIDSNPSSFTLDQDGRPMIGTTFLNKFYPPFVFRIDDTAYGNSFYKKYKDQIWLFSESSFLINVYRNNELINTIDLGSEYNSFFTFTPGINNDAYFARRYNGTFFLKKFDMISQTTTTLTAPDIGSVRNIIALPSGNMAIICWSGIFLYDGQQLQAFTDADFPGITRLHKGIVNTDGDLFLINRMDRRIYIIKDFESANPEFNIVNLGSTGVLPYAGFSNMDSISLDQDGHLWLNRTGSIFKFTIDNTSPQFLNEGVTYGITGLVYIDLNENDQFDDGEAFANQKVAMRTSNKTYETTTNPDGTYFFPYFEGAVEYEITLPTLSPLVVCDDRQRQITPTDLDQNTTLSNFKLLQKNIGSLLVKSTDKEGAWAFSRTGFENTYTTAIGNISFTKTFSNVSLKVCVL